MPPLLDHTLCMRWATSRESLREDAIFEKSLCPQLARNDEDLVEISPLLVDIDSNLVKVGQRQATSAKHRPNVAKIGQTSSKIGPTWVEFHRRSSGCFEFLRVSSAFIYVHNGSSSTLSFIEFHNFMGFHRVPYFGKYSLFELFPVP